MADVFVASHVTASEGGWVLGVAATLEDAQIMAEAEALDDDAAAWAEAEPWVERRDGKTWDAMIHGPCWIEVERFTLLGSDS